ncbi:DUF2059 domain-containing protein [Yoonia sp. R2-816]|uniref:DUF2059 domain-containing protein n=1 Tax=Yoonia sp. R2-816 TaxID=3342638 RepID=UPI00372A7056
MLNLAGPVLAATLALAGLPAFAQDTGTEKTDALFEALGLPQMLEVMRAEGLEYGDTIAQDMLPGGQSARWDALVSDIYDVDMMQEEVRAIFGEELEGDDLDAMLAFYTTEPGQTIINLEVSAREALLDDAVEEASKDSAAIAAMDETPRFQMIEAFVDANDLIETNVVGALNSNYAFYMGLIDGGAMPEGVTAELALQDVWAQEDEIRSDTAEWVYSFLLMAYQPLSDEELQAYIAFSETEAGQDLNAALFTAFNGMFDDISRALGLGVSRFMISQEL